LGWVDGVRVLSNTICRAVSITQDGQESVKTVAVKEVMDNAVDAGASRIDISLG
jgi:hypothetical protein